MKSLKRKNKRNHNPVFLCVYFNMISEQDMYGSPRGGTVLREHADQGHSDK